MRKLITIILLAGVFFSGYYVGRLPGAPDLVPYAEKACLRTLFVCHWTIAWVRAWAEKLDAACQAQSAVASTGEARAQQDQKD